MMTVARKMDVDIHIADKEAFSKSLHRISDQVRLMDQKITMKIDNEIKNNFRNQQQTIMHIRNSFLKS